jgi:hypothetical protein
MTKLGKGAIAAIAVAGVVALGGLYFKLKPDNSKDEKLLLPSNPDIEIFPDSDDGPSGGSRKHKNHKKHKKRQRKSKKR